LIGGNLYDHSNDNSIEIDNSCHTQDNLEDEKSNYNYDNGTNLSIQMLSDDSNVTDNNTRITKFSDVGLKNGEKENMSIAVRSERARSVRSKDDDSAFSHSKLMNIVYKNKNKLYNLHLDSDNDTLSTNATLIDNTSIINRNITRNYFNSNNEVLIKSKKNLSNNGNSDDNKNFHGQKTSFKNSLRLANRRNVFDKFLLCGECTTVCTNIYMYKYIYTCIHICVCLSKDMDIYIYIYEYT
jgi:hypothetical protein